MKEDGRMGRNTKIERFGRGVPVDILEVLFG
jgi:hypothetical protein